MRDGRTEFDFDASTGSSIRHAIGALRLRQALPRAGWVALTLLVLTLNMAAAPHAYALLAAVCQSGATCVNQLTATDVRALRPLGLTPGFIAAYQIAWDAGSTLVFTAVAALIFWRRPADRMALYCAYMLVLFGGATYTSLLDLGLRTRGPAWFWLIGALELLAQVSVATFLLVFPSGRFVPHWSRWGVLLFVAYEIWYVFFSDAYLGQFAGALSLVFAALIAGVVALQVYRYRRVSTYRERQQTKWVIFGLVVALGGFALCLFVLNLTNLPGLLFPGLEHSSPVRDLFSPTIFDGLLLLIPISLAIAMLRSRLFDIDALINRAMVYGLLTGVLAAVYAGGIAGIAGLANSIHWPVAASPVLLVLVTLVIAALAQPLRRALQNGIDRRFYRRKYDAQQTLAAFSASLRAEVDLEQLRGQMLKVVDETIQPAHVSLWLCPRQPHAESPSPQGQGVRLASGR